MPTPLELSNRLHTAQLAAVTKVQDLTVFTVGRIADLRDKAPKTPARVARITGPLTSQLASYGHDWAGVAKEFGEKVNDAARNGTKGSQPIPRPTPVKKSPTKKGAAKR